MSSPDSHRATEHWQLALFRKSLKKRQRYAALKALLTPIDPQDRCLLLTCGDNTGAMNYFLRELGGQWSWADLEDVSIAEMSRLLGDPVALAREDALPFDDGVFDTVIAIDAHEHVEDPDVITGELARVLKPGGQLVITTPDGDERRPAVRLKHLVGMSKEAYGHRRIGLTGSEIGALMEAHAVRPVETQWFSGFFTEVLELSINLLYVKVLRREHGGAQEGSSDPAGHDGHHHPEIAPATAEQLRRVRRSYRIYSLVYPAYWSISQLDRLLPGREGYCVIVVGERSA